MKKLRVAIVGCGQIADAHLHEIANCTGAVTVAVCDLNQDVAYQAAVRFGVPAVFTNLGDLLSATHPDVVHITIPAGGRLATVRRCFEAGAHTYVEKPVAIDCVELRTLYGDAHRHRRLLCAGHDQLFDPAWLECRQLLRSGALGEIVHVDAVQGYDTSGPYGQLVERDLNHWVRRLPGGMFQNVVSHALARICDAIPIDFDRVLATWSVQRRSAPHMPSELRVLCYSAQASATLTFSSMARPLRRSAIIYGSKATLEVDLDARSVHVSRTTRCPTSLLKLYLPAVRLRTGIATLQRNLRMARTGGLRYFAGMGNLFGAFYDAIREGGEAPVSELEAMRVTRLMDRIVAACGAEEETTFKQYALDTLATDTVAAG